MSAGPAFAVRAAVPADLAGVRAVGLRTWPPTYEQILGADHVAAGLDRWWSPAAIERGIALGRYLVADAGGEIVGMASFGERDGDPVLWRLYVVPDWQGRGMGSALLRAVLGRLPPAAHRLQVEYADGNEPAAAFYRANGFREIGRHASMLGPDVPAEVDMELRLS